MEGSLEHLAVRFKTKTAAEEFRTQFEACQAGTAVAGAEEEEELQETVVAPDQEDGEVRNLLDGVTHVLQEDYEDGDDYEEAGETIMFTQSGVRLGCREEGGEWADQGEVSRLGDSYLGL